MKFKVIQVVFIFFFATLLTFCKDVKEKEVIVNDNRPCENGTDKYELVGSYSTYKKEFANDYIDVYGWSKELFVTYYFTLISDMFEKETGLSYDLYSFEVLYRINPSYTTIDCFEVESRVYKVILELDVLEKSKYKDYLYNNISENKSIELVYLNRNYGMYEVYLYTEKTKNSPKFVFSFYNRGRDVEILINDKYKMTRD